MVLFSVAVLSALVVSIMDVIIGSQQATYSATAIDTSNATGVLDPNITKPFNGTHLSKPLVKKPLPHESNPWFMGFCKPAGKMCIRSSQCCSKLCATRDFFNPMNGMECE